MRLPRLTTRRLMVAVAAVAVVLGVSAASVRWLAWVSACNKRIAYHRERENEYESMAEGHSFFNPSNKGAEFKAQLYRSHYEGIAAYHRRMRKKWQRARGRPWLPVPPDPPEPK